MTSHIGALCASAPAFLGFLKVRDAGRLGCVGVPQAVLTLLAVRPEAAADRDPKHREARRAQRDRRGLNAELLELHRPGLRPDCLGGCRSSVDPRRMHHWGHHPACRHYVAEDGMLPLHWAVLGKAPAEITGALLAAYPEALGVRARGMLPLQHAAEGRATVDVVASLLEAYAEGASFRWPASRAVGPGHRPLRFAAKHLGPLESHPKLWARAAAAVVLASVPQGPPRLRARPR